MKTTPQEVEHYLKALDETPRRIKALTQNVDEARLQFKADQKTWSANEILAHLRSCADVWGDSIETMLAEVNPRIPYRHPRQWIKKTNYLELPFHESFQAFEVRRKKLLQVLKSLSFKDWSHGGTIQGKEHTVFTQARRMATHENIHCEEIAELLK
jgi:DinB family protein